MAKRQGGSGFIYASIPLDMTDELHDLENEKPGTVSTMTLAFMDYAKAHAKDTTAPETVPEAPEGFSLAARHVWTRLINTHNGRIGSYISQVEGGKKAQPGPGRPKGSKNKPKESADTGSEDAAQVEDAEEITQAADQTPGAAAEAAQDIRITGMGPWTPSENDLKRDFWAAMLNNGLNGDAHHATANAIASQVWARLATHDGYLCNNGFAGIDKSEVSRLLKALTPDYYDPRDVPKRCALFWEVLRAWAQFDQVYDDKLYMPFDNLVDLFMDRELYCDGKGKWYWKDTKQTPYPTAMHLIKALNDDYRECFTEDDQDNAAGGTPDQISADDQDNQEAAAETDNEEDTDW